MGERSCNERPHVSPRTPPRGAQHRREHARAGRGTGVFTGSYPRTAARSLRGITLNSPSREGGEWTLGTRQAASEDGSELEKDSFIECEGAASLLWSRAQIGRKN